MDLRGLLDFFWPPDTFTKDQAKWAWKVSLTMLALVACVIFAASPLGMAWAGDVDKKIDAKVAEIQKQQVAQGQKIDRVSELVVESLAESTAAKIRLVISKRCKAQTFAERDALAEDKRKLQILYKKYTGENYTEPGCTEL